MQLQPSRCTTTCPSDDAFLRLPEPGEYFPIAKPSQSVLAAVRESGSHEGMRALVALAKGEV